MATSFDDTHGSGLGGNGVGSNGLGRSGVGIFGAGAVALLKAMASPLKRGKQPDTSQGRQFNAIAASDPINSVLAGDIIPRLLMAHSAGASTIQPDREKVIDASDIQRFAQLPLNLDAPNLLEEVEGFLQRGMSVEAVYLDMLAPAARRLGEMWESDECDFVDVTMGLWRLQEVMREVSSLVPPAFSFAESSRTALFCPIPGDVHSFGAQMIEDIFARAGWESEVLLKPERRELLDYVAHRPLDLVGLTVSRDCPNSALASLIKAIRSVSINPNLTVLVGGHIIQNNPAIIKDIGADGTGADARAALDLAERLIPAARIQAHSLT